MELTKNHISSDGEATGTQLLSSHNIATKDITTSFSCELNKMKATLFSRPDRKESPTTLLDLPKTVFWCIIDFLSPQDATLLYLCTKALHNSELLTRSRQNSIPPRKPKTSSFAPSVPTLRHHFLNLLSRDLPSHIYFPTCDILHTPEPSSNPECDSRRYLPGLADFQFPRLGVALTIDLAMKQYHLGQGYTLALDLLSGSTTSHMTPRQNMLCTTAAKVINGRLVLRLQQWTFHQQNRWNSNLNLNSISNFASAWKKKKKKECVVRHEWYFEHARERRVDLHISSGSMEMAYQTYEKLVDEAKQLFHELDQCWCTWKEGNTLISNRERMRREGLGLKTARFARVQTGPYLDEHGIYNWSSREQNWVIGRKSFGWKGSASVFTLWTVFGDCEGDSNWRRNCVPGRSMCPFVVEKRIRSPGTLTGWIMLMKALAETKPYGSFWRGRMCSM
ncbi:hypothetical protein IFR04_009789 [Cadophora malorum]|uniref:F-box domain-containing protein n=1 Tax=Cadophora malorum TaxID=108018 RepID=A0A8H7TE06_9HELO|nr:hypothetical protein IFR04_009789 [Cadophora malorum]